MKHVPPQALLPAPEAPRAGPEVCVILPVFRPDRRYLAEQLQTIAEQTLRPARLVAVAADGTSGPLIAAIAGRFGLPLTLVEPETPLDTPRAVEAGLARALAVSGSAAVFALADQDDRWQPERLARGTAALAQGAALAHSDARLVGPEGAVLHASLFGFERRHASPGLRGLLLRNTVTGMTATFTRRTAELALPFPPQAGVHFFHDLWLALIAAATGGIARLPQALVDYRQHGSNVLGAVDRRAAALPRLRDLRHEATAYALARYLAQSLHNRLADAVAAGRLPHGLAQVGPIRPYLRRLGGAGAHLADSLRLLVTGNRRLARQSLGFAAVSAGRSVWALREAVTTGLSAAVDRFDERLYALSPGLLPVPPRAAVPPAAARDAAEIVDGRKTARFTPAFTASAPAVTVLVPTLNPTEVFAGIATALDIGAGLAARGLPVRCIATDLPVGAAAATGQMLAECLDRQGAAPDATLPFACGARSGTVAMHRGDILLATAWWTAHLAHGLTAQGFTHRRFLYLLQDYEPQFYPWGPEFADAAASYALPFEPIFNTTLLRDHFAAEGHAFATPGALTFHPAIDLDRYRLGRRPPRTGPRRIALYGRPEVPRNMFPMAVEALSRFLAAEGIAPGAVEIVSVGLRHPAIRLPGGHVIESLGKLPMADYPDWLLGADIGLSLMLSPHPSHPPLEMAAAGLRVVTNRFGAKDLGPLSPAILSVNPTAEAVAAGLARAWALPPVTAAERRVDLARLGAPLPDMLDDLAARLRPLLGGAA
jgi:hypothetical protein